MRVGVYEGRGMSACRIDRGARDEGACVCVCVSVGVSVLRWVVRLGTLGGGV